MLAAAPGMLLSVKVDEIEALAASCAVIIVVLIVPIVVKDVDAEPELVEPELLL